MVQSQISGVLSKLIASAKVFFGDKNKQNNTPHLPPKTPNKNVVCGEGCTLIKAISPQ